MAGAAGARPARVDGPAALGEPEPLEDHDELRWLGPHELDSVDWLDQDRPAVAEAGRRLRTGAHRGA